MEGTTGDDEVGVVTMRWPGDDADDERKARVLAENMAENGGIDRTTAEAYAFRAVFDVPVDRTAEALGLSPDAIEEHLAAARERIREARGLLEALEAAGEDGEGFDRRTIATARPRSEYRLLHDEFDSAVYHDRGESLAGRLLADEARDGVAAVFVVEQAGERTDRGAPGYIVERLAPSGECIGEYVVAADHLQGRIDAGELRPATLALETSDR